MDSQHDFCFSPFRLDLVNEQLWLNTQEIPLRQKTFAVLRYLLEHAQQLVTKEALLDAVWAGTTVSDIAPGVCVQELRRALGDDRQTPRFIVTVHRRGYRFIGEVVSSQHSVVSSLAFPTQSSALCPQRSVLVGRETELTQLHSWLGKALDGERQIVFVTGEPGIGKTTVVEAFLSGVRQRATGDGGQTTGNKRQPGMESAQPIADARSLLPSLWLGWGQCIEQYGPGEPYMPVLEAVARLCREPGGERLIAVLHRHAPTWLVQMPALLPAAEFEALQRQTQGATRERMLREMGEAVEAITAERPLVLILEDLHWSDASTLELLALLARRREPARLLIVSTYRPVEMLTDHHPLKPLTNDLYAHQQAHELKVTRLSEAEVGDYLAQRFPQSVFPTRLAQILYHRSEGNPLFLMTMVQELIQSAVLGQADDGLWAMLGEITELETWTPESVQQILARQRDRLGSEEHRVLAAASLAGVEFSAAAVAAALETATIQVEEHCSRLVEQQQFLRLAGISEWPDGTQAARYGFLHALYQEFWHQRVSVGRRQQWHLRIGEQKEHAYGERAKEIAAELAVHFEQGRAYKKAVQYLQHAGENAMQRSAKEAISHFSKGLELLKTLPETVERLHQELNLQTPLGSAFMATKNFGASEVGHAYTRARELCRQVGATPQLAQALHGLCIVHLTWAEFPAACEAAEQLLRLGHNTQDPALMMEGHHGLGQASYFAGKFAAAKDHLEQAVALYDARQFSSSVIRPMQDPGVLCRGYGAWSLWHLGYPDQALQRVHEALALAQKLSHPFSFAYALFFAHILHQFRKEGKLAHERAEALLTFSSEHGFPQFAAFGAFSRGVKLIAQDQAEEGLILMRQSIDIHLAEGNALVYPGFLSGLAAAHGAVGQIDKGLALLTEALDVVNNAGQRLYEVGAYMLKGSLLLKAGGQKVGEAEKCFRQALDVARNQEAKSLELQVATHLARLWQQQGKQKEAHQMLSEVYNWFTEGFDTKDLREAKALLEELLH